MPLKYSLLSQLYGFLNFYSSPILYLFEETHSWSHGIFLFFTLHLYLSLPHIFSSKLAPYVNLQPDVKEHVVAAAGATTPYKRLANRESVLMLAWLIYRCTCCDFLQVFVEGDNEFFFVFSFCNRFIAIFN